jgi:hypothetical protein
MESITGNRIDGVSNDASRSGGIDDGVDVRRTVVAGFIGAIVASAGYLIYSRLEDEHKETIRNTVFKFLEDKMSEVRAQFKL